MTTNSSRKKTQLSNRIDTGTLPSGNPTNQPENTDAVTSHLPCYGVFVYLRVSTSEQAESGAGLNAQRDACEAWISAAGPQFIFRGEYADEGISGGSPERPAFLELLQVVTLGDVVLVAKRDRLARDVLLVRLFEQDIARRGGILRSAAGEGNGDEPSDKLQRGIVDLFAEYERGVIQARIKAAMRAKKTRGELVGAVPYGYQLQPNKKTLEVNQTEAKAIIRARLLRFAGLSLREIADQLEDEGYKARNGQRFEAQQVKRMLKP